MMLLYLVYAAVVLQMFVTWSEANGLTDTQISIDQEILEAYLSPNASQQMNDPSVVRVQFDMLFPADVYADMISPGNDTNSERRVRRKAIQGESLRWPNATVPYTLEASFTTTEMEELRQAMNDYHTYSCIRFRQVLPGEADYVRIIDDRRGCWSYVGRQGLDQQLSLSMRCRKKGVIIHELGHVLGFVHEQSRPDRDQYVSIKSDNILYDFRNDFQKFNDLYVNVGGIPYDYQSIMHYSAKAASANGNIVIETKNRSYQNIIGQRYGLSFRDVKLVNMIYRCSDRSGCRIKSCPGEGFIGSDCRCWCPSGSDKIAAVHCPDIECGGTLVGSGIIRSPNFPGTSPSNANCMWMLRPSSVDGGILLEIRRFSSDPCCDFLRIIDSSGQHLLLSGAIQSQNLSLETSANVSFTTNGSATSNGFEIAFSTISRRAGSTCGGTLVDYGTIHSPNFPGSYPNSIRCAWTLQPSRVATLISLEIRRFSTEGCCDVVRISDTSGQQLSLSGEQQPRIVVIRSPAIVSFKTDASVNNIGFEIVISNASILPEICTFGWTPNGNFCYRLTQSVSWSAAQQECRTMNAFLVSIRNYTEQISVYDFLNSRGIARAWIGLNDLRAEGQWVWDSGEPVTYINWSTGEPNDNGANEDCVEVLATHRRGWNDNNCYQPFPGLCKRAKGTATNPLVLPQDNGNACGGVLLGSGTIWSPNFPGRYPNNVGCLWSLQALSVTAWISLEIRRFSTESCCDFVQISDISGQQLSLAGEQLPRLVILRSPATVFFTTDASGNNIGFEIVFTTTSILAGRV